MLQILANNQALDTSGVKFNLTLKNPMFSRDKLEGSYIFNFNLPASNRNKKIFDFPNRLEKNSKVWIDFDCKITFNGLTIVDSSTISVSQTKGKDFVANVKVGTGNVIYLLINKLLSDINLGGNRELGTLFQHPISYYNTIVQGGYPTYDFTLFPYKNLNFYDGTIAEAYWTNNIKYPNYYKEGSFYYPSNDETGGTFNPMPYVAYVIDRIFNTHGYSTGKNQFALNNDLKNLVIFSNRTNVQTYSWTDPGPPITIVQSPAGSKYVNLQNHVPKYKVLDFIKALSLFGVSLFINEKTKTFDFLFNNDLINSADNIDISDKIVEDIIREKKEYDSYGLAYKFSNDAYADNNIKSSLTDYILKDPVQSSADLIVELGTEVNEVRLVIDNDDYWIYRYDDTFGYGWYFLSHRFQDIVADADNPFDFSSDFSPLMDWGGIDAHVYAPSGRTLNIPIVEQNGSNPFFMSSGKVYINEPGLRFTFYRGLQQDNQNNLYPFATNDVYAPDNNKIPNANLSLKWEGQYGLYENCWKDFLQFITNARPLKTKALLKPTDILAFDFSKKYRIKGVDTFVKEIKIPISEKAIGPATLECYQV